MKCKNCKNLINGWCEKKLDSPAPETERKCGDYEVKTNYERIKNMSIEDMVRFINSYVYGVCGCCIFSENENCYENEDKCKLGIKEWLEMEVEE